MKNVERWLFEATGALGAGMGKLLQLSGIGPASVLQNANVSVLIDLPGVGTNYRT